VCVEQRRRGVGLIERELTASRAEFQGGHLLLPIGSTRVSRGVGRTRCRFAGAQTE
jgi:hypothetical protein